MSCTKTDLPSEGSSLPSWALALALNSEYHSKCQCLLPLLRLSTGMQGLLKDFSLTFCFLLTSQVYFSKSMNEISQYFVGFLFPQSCFWDMGLGLEDLSYTTSIFLFFLYLPLLKYLVQNKATDTPFLSASFHFCPLSSTHHLLFPSLNWFQ